MAGEVSPCGVVIVDKPAGMTSHDVVGRARRIFHTRKVGHAGTLDPMATGVLVLGLGKATRLLSRLTAQQKSYVATIRLGHTTTTDDAEGDILSSHCARKIEFTQIQESIAGFTGTIMQVPPAVSAIKVGGVRAYSAARAGAALELAPRQVEVYRCEIVGSPRVSEVEGHWVCDVDVEVDCGAGTYIRSIARDLGTILQVGGHLTRLRRVASGTCAIDDAVTLETLAEHPQITFGLEDAARVAFAARELTAEQTRDVGFGKKIAAAGIVGQYAGFAPEGTLVALLEEDGSVARPSVVFQPA